MYLVRAFCDNCIQPLLFSLFFWLGYCKYRTIIILFTLFAIYTQYYINKCRSIVDFSALNIYPMNHLILDKILLNFNQSHNSHIGNSAVNPLIYALFSKDFRFAFKRIICKCFCSGPGFKKITSRRGSDMSQMRTGGRTPSISPSAAANSLDDSDQATGEHSGLTDLRWRSLAPSVSSTSSHTAGRQTTHTLNKSSNMYDICHPLVMDASPYAYGGCSAQSTSASCSRNNAWN